MPFIPYKAAVVKQLNILNVQTLLPSDLAMGGFEPSATDSATGSSALVGTATGPYAGAGRAVVRYHRLPLSVLATYWPDPLVLTPTPTLYEALERFGQASGLHLTTKDVADTPLDFTSGKLTLTALNASNVCSGSVAINIKARDLERLPGYWPVTGLTRTAVLTNMADLVKLANVTNHRYVDIQAVSNGGVEESDDPRGNSVVTFTGKADYGFTDSVSVYFNRDNFADLFPDLYVYSTAPYNSTTRQFVKDFFPQVLDKVTLESIVDDPVVYGSTGQDVEVPIRIASTSLNLGGTVKAKVLWQAGTDFTSLRMSYIQYATQDITAANVASVRGRTLTRQFYPVSVRAALTQYAVRDMTVASVASIRGRTLTRQFYGASLRQAFLQYAVADT